jgi:hypothetical protein
MTDIIDDFLTRLANAAPHVDATVHRQLESELRQQWGGGKSYVAKQFSQATRVRIMAESLQQRRSLAECFAQAGVSRRTGYRILGKKAG